MKTFRNILISYIVLIIILTIIFNTIDMVIYIGTPYKVICTSKEQNNIIKAEIYKELNLDLSENDSIISVLYERSCDNSVYYIEYISNDNYYEIKKIGPICTDSISSTLSDYIIKNSISIRNYSFITKLGYNILHTILIILIFILCIIQIIIFKNDKKIKKGL